MTDTEKIRATIEVEETFLRMLRSDPFRMMLAAALRRAGVRDEAQIIANALTTREEVAPLPTTMADGVIAYLSTSIEAGVKVRQGALERRTL